MPTAGSATWAARPRRLPALRLRTRRGLQSTAAHPTRCRRRRRTPGAARSHGRAIADDRAGYARINFDARHVTSTRSPLLACTDARAQSPTRRCRGAGSTSSGLRHAPQSNAASRSARPSRATSRSTTATACARTSRSPADDRGPRRHHDADDAARRRASAARSTATSTSTWIRGRAAQPFP